MMLIKIKPLKFIRKTAFFLLALLGTSPVWSQDTNVLVIDESQNLEIETTVVTQKDTLQVKRFKVDGVIGVVGEHIILESDIDKSYIGLKQQNIPVEGITRCELFGKLLEDKLLAHHAVQDSIEVNYDDIMSRINQQLDYVIQEMGSEEKVYTFYNKNSMEEVRNEFFEISKTYQLAEKMQQKIFKNVDITPKKFVSIFTAYPKMIDQ